MQERADRWPSAWGFELETEHGAFAARVSNVSASGLFAKGVLPLAVGDHVRLTVMRAPIAAEVVRVTATGAALRFATALTPAQLENLRQYRDLACI